MIEKSTKLIQHLSTEYTKIGFATITAKPSNLPDKVTWLGGIEKKTLNQHRVVCVLEYLNGIASFNSAILDLKHSLHNFLMAKFWRGLGIGLIIFSKSSVDDDHLNNSVYSAERMSTSIIQWIVNLPLHSNKAQIAHTFSNVNTSFIINDVLDLLEIPIECRIVSVSNQLSPLKTKLF
jgi:hypothetical protein